MRAAAAPCTPPITGETFVLDGPACEGAGPLRSGLAEGDGLRSLCRGISGGAAFIVSGMAEQFSSQGHSPGGSLLQLAEEVFGWLPPEVRRWLELARVDLDVRREPPSWPRWVLALVVANVGSLISDAILVAIGTRIFPSTQGFGHFQPTDYGKLTLIGVTIACVGWPVVTRLSSQPGWLFLRLAVLVTLVLWLPDLWILVHGEPIRGVGVLMTMHLAIAFITYNALVHLAPVRDASGASRTALGEGWPRSGPE